MNEKIFSPFVESLRRLYRDHIIQDSFLEKKLADKRISMNEYLYIVNGKEV